MRRTNNPSDNENTTDSIVPGAVYNEFDLGQYKFKNVKPLSTDSKMSIDELEMMFYSASLAHMGAILAVVIRPLSFLIASYLAGNESEYHVDTDDTTSYKMCAKGLFWSFVFEMLVWFLNPIITYINPMWVTIQLEKRCSETNVSFMEEINKPGRRYARGKEWYELCALADKNYEAIIDSFSNIQFYRIILEISFFFLLTPNIGEAMGHISRTIARSLVKLVFMRARGAVMPGLMLRIISTMYSSSIREPFLEFGSWDIHKKLLRQKNIAPNHWTRDPKEFSGSFVDIGSRSMIYSIKVLLRRQESGRGVELQKYYFQTISKHISRYGGKSVGLLTFQQIENDHNGKARVFSILGMNHMALRALFFPTTQFINRLERLLNTLHENKRHFDARQGSSIVSHLKKLIDLQSSGKVMQWLEIDDADNIYYCVELENKGNELFDLSVFPQDSVRYTYMSQQDQVLRVEIDDITGFLAHCEQCLASPRPELPLPQPQSRRPVSILATSSMNSDFLTDSLDQEFEEKNHEKVKTRPINRPRQLQSSPTSNNIRCHIDSMGHYMEG